MSRKRWSRIVLLVIALTSLTAVGAVLAQDAEGDLSANTPGEAWYLPPTPMEGELSDASLREQLVAHKRDLCQDLEVASSVILNTGALNGFRPLIQEVAGMTIPELETELQTCTPPGIQASAERMTDAELVTDVRMVEWLLKIHLVSLDQATIGTPAVQPATEEGALGDFLELHDIIVEDMRVTLAALTDETATVEEARALGTFWQEVLIPHAEAEDRALFPFLRATGDNQLMGSADVIEAEHEPIESGIARYMQGLAAVERGAADVSALVPVARQLRGSVELHFSREEVTLIDPLRGMIESDDFAPVVLEQNAAIGAWLRDHGWQSTTE